MTDKTKKEYLTELNHLRYQYMIHGNEAHRGTVRPSECSDCQIHLKGIVELKADAFTRRGWKIT